MDSRRPERTGQLTLVSQPELGGGGSSTSRALHDVFDPARLTQARHLAGLTKKAVADALAISPAAVGQYETGVTRPRAELIPLLARALHVPVEFFVAGRPHARLGSNTAHFRSLRTMRSYQRDKAIAVVEQLWELAHELERHVQLPAIGLPGWQGLPDPHTDDIEPTAAAGQVRRQWQLGDGPIGHLVRRLEANGIIVATPARDPDSTTVDAFSTSELPRPVIVLTANRTDDVYRHRFTAAHELGHLVLHRDAGGTDPTREREADQFAAEFLTPRESVMPMLPRRLDLRRLAELSRAWGVSVHSLLYRCRETGLLSDSAASRGYQRIHALRDRPGFAPDPVANFPDEQPLMLRRAFELAVSSGLTLQELAARLGWSEARCLELLGMTTPQTPARPRLTLLEEETGAPSPVAEGTDRSESSAPQ